MFRKYLGLSAVLALSLTAGCASLPPSPDERGVSVSQLVDAIQCELSMVAKDTERHGRPLKWNKFSATASLDLMIVDTRGASVGFTRSWPFSTNSAKLVAGGTGMTGVSTRVTNVELTIDIAKLTKAQTCDKPTGFPWTPGKLGIVEWLNTISNAIDTEDQTAATKAVYTIEFKITLDGDLQLDLTTPLWTPVTGKIGANREDTHKLSLTVSPTPQAPPKGKTKTQQAAENNRAILNDFTFRNLRVLDPRLLR